VRLTAAGARRPRRQAAPARGLRPPIPREPPVTTATRPARSG